MLIPSLKTQLLELARPQLLEQGYCPGLIGEQVEVRCRIEGDLNRAVVNAVIDPVRRDPQGVGELGHGQVPGNAARVRLAALAEQPMAQAEDADGAGQDGGMPGGAMALLRQQGRDLFVGFARFGEFENPFLHLLG